MSPLHPVTAKAKHKESKTAVRIFIFFISSPANPRYNDKEYIFGGTALERDKGSELTVTYELTVDSGTAKLYWLDKGEEKMIADTSKNGTYSVTLDEGDNYLTLEGNDFCGSLQVVVEWLQKQEQIR